MIDFAAGNRPAALAVVCWSTDAGSGFNSWEGQPRHHPRDLTPTSLRLRVSLWVYWDAESILPSWLQHGAPIGILEEVETFGVFPPCHGDEPRNPASPYTMSEAGQIMRLRRMNPRSINQLSAQEGTACSSTPSTTSRATWAWAMFCCPSLLSPHQAPTGWKCQAQAHLGPSSVGRQLHGVPD